MTEDDKMTSNRSRVTVFSAKPVARRDRPAVVHAVACHIPYIRQHLSWLRLLNWRRSAIREGQSRDFIDTVASRQTAIERCCQAKHCGRNPPIVIGVIRSLLAAGFCYKCAWNRRDIYRATHYSQTLHRLQ